MRMRVCKACRRTEDEVDFYDGQRKCVECQADDNKKHQKREREWVKKNKFRTMEDFKVWNDKHPNDFEHEHNYKISMGMQ